MKMSLEKEKMAMSRIWSARETHINRLSDNTVKMFGDIQGIAGLSMPTVETLELETASTDLKEKSTTNKKSDNNSDKDQFQLFN